ELSDILSTPLTSVKLETVPCSSLLKTPPLMLCSNLRDEARRIAANIAKLPGPRGVGSMRTYNAYEPSHPYLLSKQNRFCSNPPSARLTIFSVLRAAQKPTIQV